MGSLGCEHLKNLLFLTNNFKSSRTGKIIIVDNDIINEDNLSNQFLYKNCDIGNSKVKSAFNNIKILTEENNNIKYFEEKISNDNIDFSNNLVSNKELKITGIFCGLDNKLDRIYLDELCFKYNIPFFECGINNNMGHVQPIIPFKTETFSITRDIEPPDYELCVIKNFPNNVNHLIEWSLEEFKNFDNIIKYINNNIFITLNDYVTYLISMFNEKYNTDIIKLLEINHDESYWIHGKRKPKPIEFDIKNNLHLNYIEYTLNILFDFLNISNNIIKREDIINYNNLDITIKNNNNIQFNFNKDNIKHINWILHSSNIRADNYNIEYTNYFETKGILCKIIPTNSIISSLVSGLCILEMLKYLNQLDNYKSSFINLNNNIYVKADTILQKDIEIAGVLVNSWIKLEYTKNTTLLEFKDFYENIFKLKISMIVFDTTMVYAELICNEKLNMNIKDIYNKTNINVSLLGSNDEDLPNIIINL
jgi:ubiquitin-activating enzyme E1